MRKKREKRNKEEEKGKCAVEEEIGKLSKNTIQAEEE